MPNNYSQTLTLFGDESTVQEILNLVANDQKEEEFRYIDFEKVIKNKKI